jgi:hypothetical protein
MSQRGKRPNFSNPPTIDGPSPTKRRKGRPPIASIDVTEDAPSNGSANHQSSSSSATAWQARPHLDLKMSSIYNKRAPEAPAELFRYASHFVTMNFVN